MRNSIESVLSSRRLVLHGDPVSYDALLDAFPQSFTACSILNTLRKSWRHLGPLGLPLCRNSATPF